ncbi:GRASP55/65 PDZ-like domain-domain-containing protein, partial [Catenaria anguillulae PL171]
MGNSQSQGGPDASIDPLRKGFHVLKVRDHSPAFHAGLLSYFHFIVAVNGQSLDHDASLFPATIKASIDQPVLLTVYSARSNDYSELSITPQWWTDNQQDGLIGCSIRYCDYQGALAHVWHVVEVLPNSPAQQAGLVVDSDYIVGTPEIVLREQQDLYALIAARGNEGKPLRLFVYSTVQRAVRDVTLCPRKDWGGEGLIGAELGYGALHKIP